MASRNQGIDSPHAETYFGGNANPSQGTPYPQQGCQGMVCAPPQQGIAYAPQQQGMGYNQNSNTAVVVNQPAAAAIVIQQSRPPNYIVSSIFACLCCFWPTGLFAIYFAIRSSSLADVGDMVGAADMAKKARYLMIASIIFGSICLGLIVLRSITYANYSDSYSNSYSNSY